MKPITGARAIASGVLVGLAFFASAKLGLFLSLPPDDIAVFWPPNTVVLTAFLLTRRRVWWIYLVVMAIAYFPAAIQAGYSPQRSLIFFSANVSEVLIAAVVVRRLLKAPPRFSSIREVAIFIGVAVLLAPFVSACISSADSFGSPDIAFGLAWRNWFMGDSLAHLAITPLLVIGLTVGTRQLRELSLGRSIEAGILFAALTGIGSYVFGGEGGSAEDIPFLVYMPLPLLLWATVRFGPLGASASIFLLSLISIWNAIQGRGPFTSMAPSENVLALQLFLGMVSVPVLFLAALIEERTRVGAALHLSEKRFRSMFEQAAVGVAQINSHTGRFIQINQKYCGIVGLTADEMNQTDFMRLTHPDDLDEDLENMRKLRSGEIREYSMEKRYRHRNGSDVWVNLNVSPMWEPGEEPSFHIAVVEDISERKKSEEERQALEAQIRHAQKLESLGVLAGGIAHDFNNLLVGVLGYADLAAADLETESAALTSIEEIRISARRAADLAKQMLAYSGKGKFDIQSLDLSSVVQEMAHLLDVSISKRATLKYDSVPNLPAIDADPTQLRQVVMNLITNASDAIGDDNGLITVSTGQMECDTDYLSDTYLDDDLPAGNYVFVAVSDSGSGMDEETRRRLFDPFFTTKFTGRGLGLAAVLGIVRGHKGAIEICSEPGRGTSFKVLFPASAHRTGSVESRDRAMDKWNAEGTILVVDDEEIVRKLASRMLERMGFETLLAQDGQEALEIFRRNSEKIDLVLLDLTMPQMGGEECFRGLRRMKSDVRVILSSGYSEQDTTNRFAGKGLGGFLQKPYRQSELAEALRKALQTD